MLAYRGSAPLAARAPDSSKFACISRRPCGLALLACACVLKAFVHLVGGARIRSLGMRPNIFRETRFARLGASLKLGMKTNC